jgi:hypothetical protein
MQNRRNSSSESGQIRIDFQNALDLIDHDNAEAILQAGEALQVLEQDLGRDEVMYRHQLLQEYFAARQLAKTPDAGLVQQPWQIGQVSPSLQETLATLPDSDPLPALPGSGWEETMLLAAAMSSNPEQFVSDLMATNLALAGRAAAQPEVRLSDVFKDALRGHLVERSRDAKADLRARIAAGLALGELGDPRFERGHGPDGDYLLPPMIEIDGGAYTIGTEDGHYDNEKPVHQVELAAFELAQFPVTNAEWKLFMEAGGYDDERWWVKEEDKAWQSGKSTAEGPKESLRETRQFVQENYERLQEYNWTSEDIKDWQGYADMTDEAFETLLDENFPEGRQTQPRYWNDDAFNHPA